MPVLERDPLVFQFVSSSLPPDARELERVNHSSARFYRSMRDEFVELPATLQQARSLRGLDGRPLIVVTATQDATDDWLPLQDKMVSLSTNAVHRMAPRTHSALVEDEHASHVSIHAIRDVVIAVRTGQRLATS